MIVLSGMVSAIKDESAQPTAVEAVPAGRAEVGKPPGVKPMLGGVLNTKGVPPIPTGVPATGKVGIAVSVGSAVSVGVSVGGMA